MRIPLALIALLLPLPAVAQSLGSPSTATAPRPHSGDWDGDAWQPRPVQPRGGFRPERTAAAPAGIAEAREMRQLRGDIRRARENGQLTRGEARTLLRSARATSRSTSRAAADGLTYAEGSMAASRTNMVRSQFWAALNNSATRTTPRP